MNWTNLKYFLKKVDISFIQSQNETGYSSEIFYIFNSSVKSQSFFFISDNNIIMGKDILKSWLEL